jgi:hypothetical protein
LVIPNSAEMLQAFSRPTYEISFPVSINTNWCRLLLYYTDILDAFQKKIKKPLFVKLNLNVSDDCVL